MLVTLNDVDKPLVSLMTPVLNTVVLVQCILLELNGPFQDNPVDMVLDTMERRVDTHCYLLSQL